MIRIFTLLFFISAYTFASDWWVYSYEDVSTLKAVYTYLAMINSDDGYMESLRFVVYAGSVVALFIKFIDLTSFPKYFIGVVAVLMLLFSTTASIHIVNVKTYDDINPNTSNYAKVDNVPFIFAVVTSAFSNVGYHSAKLVETVFTSIPSNEDIMESSFLKTGHLGAFKILEKINSINGLDINDRATKFAHYYEGYMQKCVFGIAMSLNEDILKKGLRSQTNIFKYVNPNNNTTKGKDIFEKLKNSRVTFSGKTYTCSSLYAAAEEQLTILKNSKEIPEKIDKLVSRITSNKDGSVGSVIKMVSQIEASDASASMFNYTMNNAFRMGLQNAWNNYSVGTSGTSMQSGFGTGLAISQLQLAGKVKAKAASIMIPTMHSVLQAVMYVLFPFVLLVQLFSGGFKLFKNYALGLLWLEFWIPSFSVLNYFIVKELQEKALDKLVATTNNATASDGMLTLNNMDSVYSTIANQAAVAGDMFWMVPMISGFILFASFHSLAGITGAIGGIVSANSSNQAMEQQRSSAMALENVNEQLRLNNPLYTGSIGSLNNMMNESRAQSYASAAAGQYLAGGGSLSSAASGNIFSAAKKTTVDNTEGNNFKNPNEFLNFFKDNTNRNILENKVKNDALEKVGEEKFYNGQVFKYTSDYFANNEKASNLDPETAGTTQANKEIADLNAWGKQSRGDMEITALNEVNKRVNMNTGEAKVLGDDAEKVYYNLGRGTGGENIGKAEELSKRNIEELINAARNATANNLDKNSIEYKKLEDYANKHDMTVEEARKHFIKQDIDNQYAKNERLDEAYSAWKESGNEGSYADFAKSMNYEYSYIDKDGKEVTFRLGNDGSIVNSTEKSTGEDGVKIVDKDSNGTVVKRNIDGSDKNNQSKEEHHDNIFTKNLVNQENTELSKTKNYNFSTLINYDQVISSSYGMKDGGTYQLAVNGSEKSINELSQELINTRFSSMAARYLPEPIVSALKAGNEALTQERESFDPKNQEQLVNFVKRGEIDNKIPERPAWYKQ